MTFRMALTWASGHGVAGSDAQWLLLEASHLTLTDYVLSKDSQMTLDQVRRFEEMVFRREAGEPIQHILGYWDFCGLTLRTDKRALIPRPETELLVEEALRLFPEDRNLRVADVGCGSGCIGLALKAKRHYAQVSLFDISDEAIELARENADLLRLLVHIERADMLYTLPGGPYDIICSNPPYIPSDDCQKLEEEVRCFDPLTALDGGQDGLFFYRALTDRVADSLADGGFIVVEVGIGEAAEVGRIFSRVADQINVKKDYAGIERIMSFRKKLR